MVNVEIYHVPGDVNVLADVMSRAIADNINCTLPREHPISKKWAEKIPPIKDNFNVDRETLFKFLTKPLTPENQNPHSRSHRRLSEPKSVQTWYDLTKETSSEERFNHAITLLEQWNKEYIDSDSPVPEHELSLNEAALQLKLTKAEECAKEIEKILDIVYSDIKNTPIFKKIRSALVEASKKLIKTKSEKITKESVRAYNHLIEDIRMMTKEIDNGAIAEGTHRVKTELSKELHKMHPCEGRMKEKGKRSVTCNYINLEDDLEEPAWNLDKGHIEIPLPEDVILKPNETKIIDTGIEFIHDKNMSTSISQLDGWENNTKIIITLTCCVT
jgi:hypothetical protein